MDEHVVARIREFNRFYTGTIGVVNQTILDSPYSLSEARVLWEIGRLGRSTASELIQLLRLDPGYLSRILKRFEREELIRRERSSGDSRVAHVALAAAGEEVLRSLERQSSEEMSALVAAIPAAAQEQVTAAMSLIQRLLTPADAAEVAVREYRSGDLSYIAYRHAVLYGREYGFNTEFEEYVLQGFAVLFDPEKRRHSQVWVAVWQDIVVGSVAIVDAGDGSAQLRWFLVEPDFRGAGVGKKLLAQAMNFCREQRFKSVFLWTIRNLEAARSLYRRAGFVPDQTAEHLMWGQQVAEERWIQKL